MNRYPKAKKNTNCHKKISFIGLLGAGKSAASAALKKLMASHGRQCNYVSTDDAVLLAMRNQAHAIILRFQQDHNIKIHRSVFESDSPTAVFIDLYGESCFRKLEAMIVADLVEHSDKNTFFDLGGKVPLRKSLAKQLKSAGVIMVYLKVSPDTIEDHLSKNDTWQTRGIYRLAGSDGWRNLALQHRSERSEKYESVADIIIETDGKTSDEIALEALREVKSRFDIIVDNLSMKFAH